MESDKGREEAIRKLGELIRDIRVAMLTTVTEDGTLRSRPMATQQTDFDGDLWFFTAASSAKVAELWHDQHVNVSYAAPEEHRYVSVSGIARLVQNPEKIKELWHPLHKAWFPQGPDDPDLALLKVEVQQAEYWDSPSSRMVLLAGLVKAMATGQRFEPGENRKLDMEEDAATGVGTKT